MPWILIEISGRVWNYVTQIMRHFTGRNEVVWISEKYFNSFSLKSKGHVVVVICVPLSHLHCPWIPSETIVLRAGAVCTVYAHFLAHDSDIQSDKIVAFGREGCSLDSSACWSTFPLGCSLLVLGFFLKMMSNFMWLYQELEKIKEIKNDYLITWFAIQVTDCAVYLTDGCVLVFAILRKSYSHVHYCPRGLVAPGANF